MENLASNAPGSKMFVTNTGLITSNGPMGPNVMTAAWTHHISYDPPLIMVNADADEATFDNILATKEFGVNLASDQQNVLSSISGKYSGKDINKIALLKELGFEFYDGEKIKAPMVKGAALNIELKLIKHEPMGDHIILIGEVLTSSVNKSAKPIIYNAGKYWKFGENIEKPEQDVLDNISKIAEKHKK
ncbi:MAG: flavin reductase family protein [Candidatus Taylorbacteria bacterium]|nr:flavin reductase family protein [Candidatus Taylorbacteria bacterium]